MDYEIKRVDASQIPALKELTRQVWGTVAPTSATLEAKFRTAPFGAEYVGYVAYPTGAAPTVGGYPVPAAYYGVFPIAVKFGEDEVLCAQSGDTMTHPGHRGKGLFIELARKAYATAREDGIQFVFGFPSESSFPGFSRRLEWEFPYHMVRFTRYVPTLPVGLARRRLKHPAIRFGMVGRTVAGSLFDIVEPAGAPWEDFLSSPAAVVRDKRLWDYKAPDALFIQSGNVGVVLKFDGDISIGDVVGEPSPGQMAGIMRRIDLLAAATGAIRIKSFFSPRSRLERLLSPLGRSAQSLPYGFVNFTCKHDPALLELTYLDYDTF